MTIKKRIESLNWPALEQSLWDRGYAKTPPLLTVDECNKLIALYRKEEQFRSRTDMARIALASVNTSILLIRCPH